MTGIPPPPDRARHAARLRRDRRPRRGPGPRSSGPWASPSASAVSATAGSPSSWNAHDPPVGEGPARARGDRARRPDGVRARRPRGGRPRGRRGVRALRRRGRAAGARRRARGGGEGPGRGLHERGGGDRLALVPHADRRGSVAGPPAVARAARDGALDVVIEPGQGFGTGLARDRAADAGAAHRAARPQARWPTGAAAAASSPSPPPSSAGRPCWPATSSPSRSTRRAPPPRATASRSTSPAATCARAARPPRPCSRTSSARCSCSVAANLEPVPDRMIICGVETHEIDEVKTAFSRIAADRARPPRGRAAGPRSSCCTLVLEE